MGKKIQQFRNEENYNLFRTFVNSIFKFCLYEPNSILK